MPCHTSSIQVCRSTCLVKCKHRVKFMVGKKNNNTIFFECLSAETKWTKQGHTHTPVWRWTLCKSAVSVGHFTPDGFRHQTCLKLNPTWAINRRFKEKKNKKKRKNRYECVRCSCDVTNVDTLDLMLVQPLSRNRDSQPAGNREMFQSTSSSHPSFMSFGCHRVSLSVPFFFPLSSGVTF